MAVGAQGAFGRGGGKRAKSRAESRRRVRAAAGPSPMPFTVTVQPSGKTFSVERDEPILQAAIRQGIGLPYGCRDGACGSCKCRMLEGRVIHGAHQQKALSHEEEVAGLILCCQAAPQTDIVLEARTVPGAGEFAIRKLPSRVVSIDTPAPDVAIVRLQLPANDLFQYRAGQYIEFILRDGARRSYSMANAPHTVVDKPQLELHIRHLPGGKFTDHVFSAMKEKEILRVEGPFGSFFLRDSDKPMILLASGTGFAPIKAIIEHMIWKGSERKARPLLGLPQQGRSLPERLGRGGDEQAAAPALHPGALRAEARGRLARPHRPRPPGGDARLPEPARAPGLRLRRADHGRVGAARLHRPLRPARRRVLRRFVHVGGRQARTAWASRRVAPVAGQLGAHSTP